MIKYYDIEELIRTNRYYTYKNTASDNVTHTHDYWEIVYQIQGSSKNVVNGKTFLLNMGDVLLMKPKDIHGIFFLGQAKTRDLYITDEKMRKILSVLNSDLYTHFTQSADPIVFSLDASAIASLEENLIIFNMTTERNDGLEDIHTSAIYYILCYYIKNKIYFKKTIPQWLTDLLLNLTNEEFLMQKVTDIIKDTNYSYGHVAREFKKYMNVSLKTYLLQSRLRYASSLLTVTDDSVSAIAEKVGFNSANGFINAFSSHYGFSPHQYRKRFAIKPVE